MDAMGMKRALLLVTAAAAVYLFVASAAAARLPADNVAMHVSMAGQVDKSTSRADAITYLAGVGAALLLLAVAALCVCRFVPTRFLSIPNKDYWTTSERTPTARQMMMWDAAVIFSMPFLALSFIPVNMALMSKDPTGASALWIVLPIGVWLLAMLCYVIWMVKRRYRPAPG
jgi:hypothetical protein